MKNLVLDSSQMLQTWRRCAGLEPSENSCSIERFDGIDIDAYIRQRMRLWYLDLLCGRLPDVDPPVSDISEFVTLDFRPGDCFATATADPSVISVITIRLSGWQHDAAVTDATSALPRIELMKNPFACPGCCDPLAWLSADGAVRVSPAKPSDTVISARGVIDPGPDLYILPPLALTTIPNPLTRNL